MNKRPDKFKKLAAVIAASLLICTMAACSSKSGEQSSVAESGLNSDVNSGTAITSETSTVNSGESSVSESQTTSSGESSGTVSENVSTPDASGYESSIPYGTEDMAHPSDLVGKWSLKLETSDLTASELSDAEERMKRTSITLRLDGTAFGDYGGSTIDGAWGVQSGYVYIILGSATEVFAYYIDTLVSVNYPGMYFVK